MPYRPRRFTGSRGHSRQRRKIWCTTFVSTAVVSGQVNNVDLTGDLTIAGTSHLGITIARAIVRIAPSVAPTVQTDHSSWGIIVGRLSDIGNNVAGAVSPLSPDLDWMFITSQYASPTYDPGGSNLLMCDNRSKRRLDEVSQHLILSHAPTTAAATTWNYWARVLVLLP